MNGGKKFHKNNNKEEQIFRKRGTGGDYVTESGKILGKPFRYEKGKMVFKNKDNKVIVAEYKAEKKCYFVDIE